MKKTFIKSGKPIDAKIISVENNETSNADVRDTLSFFVINHANTIFKIEKRNGKTIVENSLIPKSLKDNVFSAMKPIRKGKTGYPK